MKGPWRNLYRVIGKTFFVWGFSFLHIKISRCAVTYICPRTREAQLCRGLGNRDRTRPPSACGCEATHLFVPFADGSLPAGTLRLPWAEGHPENRLLPCRPSFLRSSRRGQHPGQGPCAGSAWSPPAETGGAGLPIALSHGQRSGSKVTSW